MRLTATLIATLIALGITGIIWHQLCQRSRSAAGSFQGLFPVLLAMGVLCRLAYLFLTPVFYAPDEQAHFNYIKFIAERGEFPILTTKLGDPGNEWEYFQPPLYYLALAPIYALANASGLNLTATVFLLRGFSFLLWVLNVWFG